MNPQIEMLAALATTTEHGADNGFDRVTLDTELFAKLIIQECGVALNPMLRDMVSRGRAVDLIKQHFGVDQ